MSFLFEKLDVYQKSSKFVVEIHDICRKITDKSFVDQLKRASLSIPLNIAEGNGKPTVNDKKRYLYIARGSLLECVAIIQLLDQMSMIDKIKYSELYSKADEIGRMLAGLIKSIR